jgi:hypothetical protein
MANKYVKEWSTFLVIREMQSKTSDSPAHSVRMAAIKKTSRNCASRMKGKGTFIHCW